MGDGFFRFRFSGVKSSQCECREKNFGHYRVRGLTSTAEIVRPARTLHLRPKTENLKCPPRLRQAGNTSRPIDDSVRLFLPTGRAAARAWPKPPSHHAPK